MKNIWLIDDESTRQKIHDYVTLMRGAPVQSGLLTLDQTNYCVDHAVRHILSFDTTLSKAVVSNNEHEEPDDMALFVARYYRDLKFYGSNAVKPAHDWVVVYFSKMHPDWDWTLQQIQQGAYYYSGLVLNKTLKRNHPAWISKADATAEWTEWKRDFADIYA